MLSKFLSEGNKIELRALDRNWDDQTDNGLKVYHSDVHSILSKDTMEISMPIEKSKLVLLPVDSEFEVIAYSTKGLYRCEVRIIDRYKSNNVYLLVVELTDELSKYQRREYYRYSCVLDMLVRELDEEEAELVEKRAFFDAKQSVPMNWGVIIDISGGGLRFVSEERYELDSLVYCTYQLKTKEGNIPFEILGKVLAVKKSKNRPENFEHRISYYKLDVRTREKIIKFIFEEERKERKKDSLM